jgi:hypothetical protein
VTPLERVTSRVNRDGDVNDFHNPRPLLTLQEFFEGNDVDGSIWCNLNPPPSPGEVWEILRKIEEREDVAEVLVQVSMFDDPLWPFSEIVWVITSASADEVLKWFSRDTAPDRCSEGWTDDADTRQCVVPDGMQPVCCWWD